MFLAPTEQAHGVSVTLNSLASDFPFGLLAQNALFDVLVLQTLLLDR